MFQKSFYCHQFLSVEILLTNQHINMTKNYIKIKPIFLFVFLFIFLFFTNYLFVVFVESQYNKKQINNCTSKVYKTIYYGETKCMKKTNILIIDDDNNICQILKLYLTKEEYTVQIANNGLEAKKMFKNFLPDLVLLDIMMPEIDGLEICRFIKKHGDCPVIMISAKSEVFDRILGLELGADDYITKPFEVKEVVARVKAVLRRTLKNNCNDAEKNALTVTYDKLSIDIIKYEALIDNKKVEMPPKEIELLFFLASNPNKVFTRSTLLNKVWGPECYVDNRTVDVHIKRLRKKLENISDQWNLKTVWGVGYKFETINPKI